MDYEQPVLLENPIRVQFVLILISVFGLENWPEICCQKLYAYNMFLK